MNYKTTFLIILCLILTGCLYPKDELSQNEIPHEEQLNLVQTAVNEFKEQTDGLVPIKTKSSETPIFEKYIVDFDQLKERNLISSIPGNAFESGGIYQYVLIDPDGEVKVKLIDLRTTDAVHSVQVKLKIYRDKNLYPPFGEKIAEDLYTINYEELGLKEAPHAISPFTKEPLPIIMDVNGDLYIDYRIDLNQILQEKDVDYEEGEDLRYLLTDDYPFVPAHSLPYTIKDGEAVFMENSSEN